MNPHLPSSKPGAFPIKLTHIMLVIPRGIEPRPSELQPDAHTSYAREPLLWCCEEASNPRPVPYQGTILPTELSQPTYRRETSTPYSSGNIRCKPNTWGRTSGAYRARRDNVRTGSRHNNLVIAQRNNLVIARCLLAAGVGFEPTHPF